MATEELKKPPSEDTATGAAEETMLASVRARYGHAADVLTTRRLPVPAIGPAEVLVRVHSSSVNAMEWHLLTGKPYVMRPVLGFRPKAPTLGADVSGTVVAVGAEVTRFRPGDEVFGEIGSGAYARYAAAREDHLALKPANIGFEEAAGVGVAGLTALQGLRDVLAVEPGERLLVNGASGGVGTFAIQVGKVLGAESTAVCSTRNVAQARDLGADRVVDYLENDVSRLDERFDAIFDVAGNLPLRVCKRLLAPRGRYLAVGGPKGDWTGPLLRVARSQLLFAFGGKKSKVFVAESRTADLERLGEMLATGQIRTVIEDRVGLADLGVALERQGSFHARAKTIVVVDGAH